jgi:copper(I)-binding protein
VFSPSIAHQFQKENININHPHIKFTISSGPAAGYMTIVNMGEKPDKLLNIEVDFAVAELHLSEINDGIVSMNKVDFIEIPAQIAKSLKPGGYHVMFSKFNIELIDESELIGVLNFELAGEIKVVFEVETQKHKDDFTEH